MVQNPSHIYAKLDYYLKANIPCCIELFEWNDMEEKQMVHSSSSKCRKYIVLRTHQLNNIQIQQK